MPRFNETHLENDPREVRKNQDVDRRLEEWRKTLQLGGESASAFIISRGSQGGTGAGAGTGTQGGLRGFQGSQGVQGAQGASNLASVYRIHVWIAKRADGKPGDGSIIDPYNGSTQDKFDRLMRSFGPNTTIHLSDDTFQTKGSLQGTIPLADQWRVKSGWKILGSGVGRTILQLVGAEEDNTAYAIILNNVASGGFADDVEVSDLTLDCNLSSQPGAVIAGGLFLSGSRIKVSNIRVINWGSKDLVGAEPFAFAIAAGNSFYGDTEDVLVEKVRIEEPSSIAGNVGTMMLFTGGEILFWTSASITRSGSVATVNLGIFGHSFVPGNWFNVRNATQPEYNGNFQILSVIDAFRFTYTVSGTPATPATGPVEVEHLDAGPLGKGVIHGLVVRDCYLDCHIYSDVGLQGMSFYCVEGAVVESNTIRNTDNGIYMDTGVGESIIIRSNVIQRTENGIVIGMTTPERQFNTLIVDGNLIELMPLIANTGTFMPKVTTRNPGGVPGAMLFAGGRSARPLTFRRLIIRNNYIRFYGDAEGSQFITVAIGIISAEQLVIQNNLIDLSYSPSILIFTDVLHVFARGNRKSDGTILLATSTATQQAHFDPDIEADKIHKVALLG